GEPAPLPVSPERLDLDGVVGDSQARGKAIRPDDHARRPADVVDGTIKALRRLLEAVPVDPPGEALPSVGGRTGEGVEDAEVRVLLRQRIEFVWVQDLVLARVAEDEPDRNRQGLVRRVFRHPFEGRNADSSREKDRGPRFVQHEIADWSEDADFVPRLEGCEGGLAWGVGEADGVLEVRARGTRCEGHGPRVHALIGLQLEEGELGRPEDERLRFLDPNLVGRGRERSRGDDGNAESPRWLGHAQTSRLLTAGTRAWYFVTWTGGTASPVGWLPLRRMRTTGSRQHLQKEPMRALDTCAGQR